MQQTTNYNLSKPSYIDSADIKVLNDNFDEIDKILEPEITDTTVPTGTPTKALLKVILSWLANRIKAITGKANWWVSPSVTLEQCNSHIQNGTHNNATSGQSGFMPSTDKQKLDNATASPTAGTLMLRDASGRSQLQTPSSTYDIANKTYVDSNFVSKYNATTLNAVLTAQSNTSYTTKQVRNIVIWTSGTTPPATSYGDIVIKIN